MSIEQYGLSLSCDEKKSSSYTYLINRTIKYTFICRLDLFVILVYVFEAKKYDNSY